MHIPEGLGLYWRTNDTVQLGLSPERNSVFEGLYPREIPMLSLLRNPCTLEDIDQWARSNQVDADRARKLWTEVSESGLAQERPDDGTLAPTEQAAAARAGIEELDKLSSVAVEIHGAGLIGARLALTADLYGFSSIRVADPNPVSEPVARVLGLSALGKPLESVIRPMLSPAKGRAERTFVVSVSSRVYPLHIARTCLAEDIPYLPVVIAETDIQVGPFVAGSPCIECVESARTDRDEAWPLLSAQAGRLPMLEADAASALQVCSLVVNELIEHAINGDMEPRLSSSILHIPPPPLWPFIDQIGQHASCGCGADAVRP
ncbi:hypothetical protein [Flaviflexus huanghaiensis]|uniref:hypothetical protein n=1 Tax=Flaviflexus huanghaiensis TaxID=1111473 RepID=UPI0015FD529A|nr:hypothetical protein [Flaviflexus huanghaiensis]